MHGADGPPAQLGGVANGLVVLGVLWWAWVGYAWLTSVVDPEEGPVRLVMFAAMAALLVARCACRMRSMTSGSPSRVRVGFVRCADRPV